MDTTNTLLLITSVLLGLVSLPFVMIAYFLKDLHKDFKQMKEKVNTMHTELRTHISLSENLARVFQREIDKITGWLKKIDRSLFDNKEKQK